jgi:hypothetical protein
MISELLDLQPLTEQLDELSHSSRFAKPSSVADNPDHRPLIVALRRECSMEPDAGKPLQTISDSWLLLR